MLMRSVLTNAIAVFALTVTVHGVKAAPAFLGPDLASAEASQTLIAPARSSAQPVRRIVSSRSSAGEKCGVWRCTWPVSGGGCLVWEKTLCKIKTIDPFE